MNAPLILSNWPFPTRATTDIGAVILRRSQPDDAGALPPVGQTAAPASEITRTAVQPAARPSPASVPTVDKASRPIEPMLLVHQERVETFLILTRFIGRAVRAIAARATVTS